MEKGGHFYDGNGRLDEKWGIMMWTLKGQMDERELCLNKKVDAKECIMM